MADELKQEMTEDVAEKLKELEEYKKQKESIRKIVGAIGGTSSRKEKIANLIFLVLVLFTFVLSIFTEGIFHHIALDIGILLVSLKMVYFLHNEARVSHFQFWILSSIEWQSNNLERRIRDLDKKIDNILDMSKEKENLDQQ